MVDGKTPSTHCFLTDEEYEHALKYYPLSGLRKDDEEWFDQYDWNRENYTLVEIDNKLEFYEPADVGYENREMLRVRIIRHLSSDRYFKLKSHWDSWGGLEYGSPGDYGDIVEVQPVVKTITVFEEV